MSTQLKTLSIDYSSSGAGTAVELGETPFFPGTTCILTLPAAVPASTSFTIETAATDSAYDDDWTVIATCAAASGPSYDIGPLDKFIRANVTDTSSGTVQGALVGSF